MYNSARSVEHSIITAPVIQLHIQEMKKKEQRFLCICEWHNEVQ